MLHPHLEILPEPQRRLWPELRATPREFTLYGGTAIALRLGHRASVDFDFFSFEPFVPQRLLETIPYLRGAAILQSSPNTLTCRIERGEAVQVSFFGGLRLGQVAASDTVEGPGFAVASLIDLAGLKAAVVTQRAEAKDYLDIHALLRTSLPLPQMLAAASVIYAGEFSPVVSLKALAYTSDPALRDLPEAVQADLAAAVKAVDVTKLPTMVPMRPRRTSP